MPATVSTSGPLQSPRIDARDSTSESGRAPAAWPEATSRGQFLAERANSVVWSGKRDRCPPVQVVVLDPEATALERTRFVDGAARLQALGHIDGLTHVVEVDEDGRWYVCDDPPATELGQVDVSEWALEERLDFVAAVLGVLHSLHTRGLAHGALCLNNLLVSADRLPILSEVGIVDVALLSGRDGTRLDAYRLFAAPEVCHGESFDSSADLYSVGRLLEHVLIGRLVESGERRTIAFGAHAEFAEMLGGVAARATHHERGARYPSAREMMRELGRIAREVRRSQRRDDPQAEAELAAGASGGVGTVEDWKGAPFQEARRPLFVSPRMPAVSLSNGTGRRGAASNRSRSGRRTTLSTVSALELVAIVLAVLVAAAWWWVR